MSARWARRAILGVPLVAVWLALVTAAACGGDGDTAPGAGAAASGGGHAGGGPAGGGPAGGGGNAGAPPAGAFSFVVFGDLNGGGCERNAIASQVVAKMAQEPNVAFFVSTGDIIDGWVEDDGGTACFGATPSPTCAGGQPAGNIAALFAPIKERAAVPGLSASFYPVIGNHDDNWGSGWYPDPCGGGICDFLSPLGPDTYLNHPHGDICSLTEDTSAHGTDFYYSFSYGNSTFIVLRQNDDEEGMLACNGDHDCVTYCSDPAFFDDATRNEDCYDVAQFDWLRGELATAAASNRHVFVFTHAVMLGSGDSHGPGVAAEPLRALFEQQGVVLLVNGHNHAYERTHPVRGTSIDPTGTTYITVGVAGATTDDVYGDWFTAATYANWTTYGDLPGNAGYLKVTVDGGTVSADFYSLGVGPAAVDSVVLSP
jgi:hypothetical protein